MSAGICDVTVLICHFKAENLTRRCVEGFRMHYPEVLLVVVDDGSRDRSTEYIRELGERPDTLTVIREDNGGHGAALNTGMNHVETRYVFTMDNDVTLHRGGFLELMRERFHAEPRLFSIGRRVRARKGTDMLYVHPSVMMMDRKKFRLGRPFTVNHGAPALDPMVEAQARGEILEDFPVLDYVDLHGGSGTRKALRAQIAAGEIGRDEIDRWNTMIRRHFREELA